MPGSRSRARLKGLIRRMQCDPPVTHTELLCPVAESAMRGCTGRPRSGGPDKSSRERHKVAILHESDHGSANRRRAAWKRGGFARSATRGMQYRWFERRMATGYGGPESGHRLEASHSRVFAQPRHTTRVDIIGVRRYRRYHSGSSGGSRAYSDDSFIRGLSNSDRGYALSPWPSFPSESPPRHGISLLTENLRTPWAQPGKQKGWQGTQRQSSTPRRTGRTCLVGSLGT